MKNCKNNNSSLNTQQNHKDTQNSQATSNKEEQKATTVSEQDIAVTQTPNIDKSDDNQQNNTNLQEEISKLQKECSEYKDKYLRALAEMDNLKKRHEKEKIFITEYALEKFLLDLLNVVDAFDLALNKIELLKTADDNIKSIIEGICLVKKQLDDLLKKYGVEPIEAKNKHFDPNLHHAIQQIESNEVQQEIVKEEFSKGYLLKNKLLRASVVSVIVPAATKNDNTDSQTLNKTDTEK